METNHFSEFIVHALNNFDKKIASLEEGSVNKLRLHNNLHMALICKVSKLSILDDEQVKNALDHLFKQELTNEIIKLQEENSKRK